MAGIINNWAKGICITTVSMEFDAFSKKHGFDYDISEKSSEELGGTFVTSYTPDDNTGKMRLERIDFGFPAEFLDDSHWDSEADMSKLFATLSDIGRERRMLDARFDSEHALASSGPALALDAQRYGLHRAYARVYGTLGPATDNEMLNWYKSLPESKDGSVLKYDASWTSVKDMFAAYDKAFDSMTENKTLARSGRDMGDIDREISSMATGHEASGEMEL